VLKLAVEGKTDEMIARELGIERGTVNSYWVRIRGKLGHLSRTELAARFVQQTASDLYHVTQAETEAAAGYSKKLLDAANAEIEHLKAQIEKLKDRT
jgi:hypothetical protein